MGLVLISWVSRYEKILKIIIITKIQDEVKSEGCKVNSK